MSYFKDFISIFYNPDEVLEKIKEASEKATTLVKILIGIALTIITTTLTFFGMIILQLYYLITGKIAFSTNILLDPLYVATVIPLIFWLFDTLLLVIPLLLMKVRIDVLRILNIRAFSLAPIPILVLYTYYLYTEVNLRYLISLPTNPISIIHIAWSIILLIRGLHKLFNLPYSKATVAGIFPLIVKTLIAKLLP